MKKLISLALALTLVLSTAVVACAAPSAKDISAVITMGNDANGYAQQTITVKGNEVAEAAGKLVTLRIWKLGKSASDYSDEPSARADDINLFALLLQTRADSKGNFTFEFLFGEPVGTYTADIKIQGEEIIQKQISTADLDTVNSFVDDINDADELASLGVNDFQPILDNPADYGIDLTVFNHLGSQSQNAVILDVINALKANNEGGKKNTVETVVNSLSESTLVAIFDETDDGEILAEAVDVYSALLDLENLENASGIYDLYDGFGDEKNEVLSSIGDKNYGDVDGIIDAFKEAVFIKAVKGTQYYTDLEPIIDDNLDYLAFSSKYEDKYTDDDSIKKYVLKEINSQKGSLNTIAKFKDAFEDAVDGYGTKKKKGGSGGGSSGSSSSITVDSSLTQAEAPVQTVASYNDIHGHWAQEAINYLTNSRVLSGRGDGTFDPDGAVTRAEFVKMIVVAYGLYDENAVASFNDVDSSSWYYPYVASMVDWGYILGDSDGNFNPNALISRQDMAVILHRVLQGQHLLPVIETIELLFDDFDEVSPYAQNSIAYMSNMKLINGSDRLVRPLASSTRAEAAQIIYNAVTEVGSK